MIFSSITFLYYFLPVTLGLYYLVPKQFKNTMLLAASLFFYFWGEPKYGGLMLAEIFVAYGIGRRIEKYRQSRLGVCYLAGGISFCLILLFWFKYADFLIRNLNYIPGVDLGFLYMILPIGISFYTFQIISYEIDVYRGTVAAQKSLVDFALYVSLFPQLIAGPIVRYRSLELELKERVYSASQLAYGIRRFVLGLGKKVILANTIGEMLNKVEVQSVLGCWLTTIGFTLQIYYDFSGYSDMAIGLGRMFGFHFPENFKHPYCSKTITEFWQRWHISLGRWFRDYVYIPMGGNQVSKGHFICNILAVWFLTGMWHGASWNFILWGLYFGILLLGEKMVFRNLLEKMPKAVRHIYTIFFVMAGMVLFEKESLSEVWNQLGGLFGVGMNTGADELSVYYLKSYAVTLMIAIIGATPLLKNLWEKCEKNQTGEKIVFILEPFGLAGLLLLITAHLIDGAFNPFLYFRF